MASSLSSSSSSLVVPNDIALTIASFLEAKDVCCLGGCSKFWCDMCNCDSLWVDLIKKRWPNLGLDWNSFPPFQGWKSFYVSKHRNLSRGASVVINFVEQCAHNESLEVGYYLKAINDLRSMELGFKDVQMFLLARKHGVLLNLIGLHYCICFLGISPSDVTDALNTCQVAERQVCVSWFKLGRWFAGFRLPDERRVRKVSLGELAMATGEGEEVLRVLNRGAVHEVLRVQITWDKPNATAQSSHIIESSS